MLRIDRSHELLMLFGCRVWTRLPPVITDRIACAVEFNAKTAPTFEFLRVSCRAIRMILLHKFAPGLVNFLVARGRAHTQYLIGACEIFVQVLGIFGRLARIFSIGGRRTTESKCDPFRSRFFDGEPDRHADKHQIPCEQGYRRADEGPTDDSFAVACFRQPGVPGEHLTVLEQVIARRNSHGHRFTAGDDLPTQKRKRRAHGINEVEQWQSTESNLFVVEALAKLRIEGMRGMNGKEKNRGFRPVDEVKKFLRFETEGFIHPRASLTYSYTPAAGAAEYNLETHPQALGHVMQDQKMEDGYGSCTW